MEATRKEEDTGRRSGRISMAQHCESGYVGNTDMGDIKYSAPKRSDEN